jgi:hypothetical protein
MCWYKFLERTSKRVKRPGKMQQAEAAMRALELLVD